MNGKQYTYIQQNGKMRHKYPWTIWIIVFGIIGLFISGCTSGRGDWRYELIDGYALDRCNAHSIRLIYRDNPSNSSADIVIDEFYITFYCMNESYIGLKGIPTKSSYATDEELCSGEIEFYLVDVSSGTVYGPYMHYAEFESQCKSLECGYMGNWLSTADLNRILP